MRRSKKKYAQALADLHPLSASDVAKSFRALFAARGLGRAPWSLLNRIAADGLCCSP